MKSKNTKNPNQIKIQSGFKIADLSKNLLIKFSLYPPKTYLLLSILINKAEGVPSS